MFRSSVKAAPLLLFALAAQAKEDSNPLFAYAHLLPSPFTIGAGRFMLGTLNIVGITDFLQFSTNIVLDFNRVYNGRFSVTALDFPTFALGANVGLQYFNYNELSPYNPSVQTFTVSPGGVAAFQILSNLAVFAGGNYLFSSASLPLNSLETSGFTSGAVIESDLSWAYNPEKKRLGNLLSVGLSYDFTYGMIGYGISHHWPHFQLGFHYFPEATINKLLPIASGAIVGQF